jgi:hypothetical protein
MNQGVADPRVQRVLWIVGLTIVALLILAGCSTETESPAASAPEVSGTTNTEVPTIKATAQVIASDKTEEPAATAVPTPESSEATAQPAQPTAVTAPPRPQAEATPPPVLSPLPPASEVTYEQQKELLSTLVQEWYAGENNNELPRLNLPPDVRDNRRGGILIHIEINGDEYVSTTLKKAELDKLMRDTYEVIYGTGYEVTEVMITGIMDGVINAVVGGTVRGRLQAFRSRLRGDAAATVDWTNKESLDFNEIWDNVLLNLAWKRDLTEEAEGGVMLAYGCLCWSWEPPGRKRTSSKQ